MCREGINTLNLCNPLLVMGVCSIGPYRYGEDNLRNAEVKWISWGYSSKYINPNVVQKIKSGEIRSGTEVAFASWSIGIDKKARFLRKGAIDHIVLKEGYVEFTVFLKEALSVFIEIPEKDYYLCRFVDITHLIQGNLGENGE